MVTINGRVIKDVAVDFDGTLFTEDKFPEVRDPNPYIISIVKKFKSIGCSIIL